MKKTHYAICPICGAACGLAVEVENNRIVGLRGDKEDPHSRGHVCPKGMCLPELHSDPDRIVEPQRKTAGGEWESVSWSGAFDDIAGRLAGIIAKHGKDAVAVYAGDPATRHYANLFAVAAFLITLDTKNLFTANSLDSLPRQLASYLLYGNSGMLPVPDVSRTDYFLILGGNPVVTNGSVMTAPGFSRHIRDLQARGGKLVVVDPRRNETARLADEHYFIRPGADALFLLAVIHTVFEEKLDKPGVMRGKVSGWNKLRRLADDFSPESVAAATGMAAEHIRKIARDFAGAGAAACYGRMGICAQDFGTTATLLADALNIVTGNLDRAGGFMFAGAAVDLAGLMALLGMSGNLGRWRTRGSGLPEFNGELPAVELANEIETPGPRQIRALITVGGNPGTVVPNSARINSAFAKLDFMVCLDPYINATTRHADYILPPTMGLEQDHYPVVSYSIAIRNTAKYSPAAVKPPAGVRHDWAILWELSQRLAARRAGAPKLLEELLVSAGKRFDPKAALQLLLDGGPYGLRAALTPGRKRITLKELEKTVHGIDLGLHTPQLTGNKRVNLVPDLLASDLGRVRLWRDRHGAGEGDTSGELLLISRRQSRFINSSLHNIEKLASGPDQCVLEINPADAAARGISDGEAVSITTGNGTIQTTAAVTGDVMAGVVSFPFGWNGKLSGTRMSVSDRHSGANVNDITDETLVDSVSGMSAFNGTPVCVSRIAPGA